MGEVQKLFAKDEAAQLVAQLLDLLRIAGFAKVFGQLKKACFLRCVPILG
jgi:hypothetical protein